MPNPAIIKSKVSEENLSKEEKKQRYNQRLYKWICDNMIHYKMFVPIDIRKNMNSNPPNCNPKLAREYVDRLKPIYKKIEMSLKDYQRKYIDNILFIHDGSLMGEVFCAVFLNMRDLIDFRFMDILEVQELWYGRLSKTNFTMDELGELHTFHDIREDVLCFHVSSGMMEVGKAPEIMTTVMSARSGKNGQITNRQNTWIYFEGTIDDLRNSRFNLWEDFFKRNGLIVDLNPQSSQHDSDNDTYCLF